MSASRTGHQGLYPIIRRMRRPLLPVDPPAENKPVAISRAEESKSAEAPEVAEDKKADAGDSTN